MKRAVCQILRVVFLSLLFVTPAFPQTVSAFATISVCDVPGTSQILAQGTHIAGESGAEHPHFHTRVTVGGLLRQFALASRCAADFNGVNIPGDCVGDAGCSPFTGICF